MLKKKEKILLEYTKYRVLQLFSHHFSVWSHDVCRETGHQSTNQPIKPRITQLNREPQNVAPNLSANKVHNPEAQTA